MRTFYRYLLIGVVSVLSTGSPMRAQTAGAGSASAAAAGPNNWEKEYADGTAAYNAGNYREAEKQLKAALKSTRDFASNDPKLMNSLRDLAQAYRAQSKYADTKPLMERYMLPERALPR